MTKPIYYLLDTGVWRNRNDAFFESFSTELRIASCELSVIELGHHLDLDRNSHPCQKALGRMARFTRRYFPSPDTELRRCFRIKSHDHLRSHSHLLGHLGMLNVPAYRDAWEKKLAWYKATGFFDQLITSQDASNGGIDASEIERIARVRILGE